jgi:hypothetical protein
MIITEINTEYDVESSYQKEDTTLIVAPLEMLFRSTIHNTEQKIFLGYDMFQENRVPLCYSMNLVTMSIYNTVRPFCLCDKTPEINNLKGAKIYFGSWF